MILLILLYLSITSTLAVPTRHPPLPPEVSNLQSILGRENAPPNTRTIWNIIWSCFSTVVACAWIAVHPNIPALEDSKWKILRRRLMVTAYILLAPEMVIMWAARQYRDARLLAEEFQIKGRPGWTKTHAFFLIMGGFTLHTQGKPLRVLDWRDLEALARAGLIDWPNITEEEIKDKSKGDYLSKGIVILQTTWFIIQFFARAASKLTITELEVVTLAFSTLIGVIYFLWWDKPLDVRCSVPVHLVKQTTEHTTSDNVTGDDLSPEHFCICLLQTRDVSPSILEGEEAAGGDQTETDNSSPLSPPKFPNSRPSLQNTSSNSVPTMIIHYHPEPPIQIDGPSIGEIQIDGPRIGNPKQFYLYARNSCRKYSIFIGLLHAFTVPLGRYFVGNQFNAMMFECTLRTDTQEPNPSNPLRSGPLRVPTFYSYTVVTWNCFIFAICVSVLFGAIHSVAWYYGFSTSSERWGWRISSIIVSVVPLILLSMLTAFRMKIVNRSKGFSFFLDAFSWPYYISWIALLLFPLIGLRALPPEAYVDLDWATIIPHI